MTETSRQRAQPNGRPAKRASAKRNGPRQHAEPHAPSFFVRWQNFRGFEDTDWVQLSPITVVIGRNNSGKTSLHAPLLLLKQSLEDPGAGNPLALRGRLINLGRFEDCVREHLPNRTMTLALRWFGAPTRRADPTTLGKDAPASLTVEFGLVKGRARFDPVCGP